MPPSRTTRRTFVAAAGLTALAGCLGSLGATRSGDTGSDDDDADADAGAGGAGSAPDPTTVGSGGGDGTATPDADGGPPTADRTLPVEYAFGDLRSEVRSGGPPKDGIPAIDAPQFLTVAEADDENLLDPGAVVFGVVRGDDVKAYPQNILVWHEIVNDVLDGTPVSVTYCPLTGTSMGFERGPTTFGVSGKLLNSNLVMYDRATDSRWPQVLATAISGTFEGESLREFPVTWTSWGRWREAHPDTLVLSEDTGYIRGYDRDPYGAYNPPRGYYNNPNTLFSPLREDGRYGPKEVVIGARTDDGVVAFHKGSLRERGVLTGDVGGVPYLAVYGPDLDTGYVYRNPEGLSVQLADGADDGTVSVGGASDPYRPDALPLERVVAFDAMWFAWAGFYPGTEVYA